MVGISYVKGRGDGGHASVVGIEGFQGESRTVEIEITGYMHEHQETEELSLSTATAEATRSHSHSGGLRHGEGMRQRMT
jgi:hypothetical protein